MKTERLIIRLAISHFQCRTCRAQPGLPCVPFRTSGEGDYGNWYAHAARRSLLDQIWKLGFTEGVEHQKEYAEYLARKYPEPNPLPTRMRMASV